MYPSPRIGIVARHMVAHPPYLTPLGTPDAIALRECPDCRGRGMVDGREPPWHAPYYYTGDCLAYDPVMEDCRTCDGAGRLEIRTRHFEGELWVLVRGAGAPLDPGEVRGALLATARSEGEARGLQFLYSDAVDPTEPEAVRLCRALGVDVQPARSRQLWSVWP